MNLPSANAAAAVAGTFICDLPMVFALNASREFGLQVSQHLGVALSEHEEREFEDGEHKTRPLVNVRGRNVFVIMSLHSDSLQSSNDKLCRLLFFIGALKDAAAARVTVLTPYLAYARKDRKTKQRDPVTSRYVATLFEAAGCDVLATLDVHNLAAFQNAFRCGTEHLEAGNLFARHFSGLLRESEVAVVSPDAGGIKRADRLRQLLSRMMNKPIGAAFTEKHRSEGVISGNMLVGDLEGKDAIIIDDLISTGNTIMRTVHACEAAGAVKIYAAASHGLFVNQADEVLADSVLSGIVVTDTVPPFRLADGPTRNKLVILNTTALFAEAIRRMHRCESLSELPDVWPRAGA